MQRSGLTQSLNDRLDLYAISGEAHDLAETIPKDQSIVVMACLLRYTHSVPFVPL